MGYNKKQMVLDNPSSQRLRHVSSQLARNLGKTDLGSVIFGCKHATYKECIFKQLFGLPSLHYTYVRNVRPGMPLFLFNYSDRKLHGIFEAQSEGQMNINKYAWTFDGDDVTQFPAQVKVRIRKQCQPLTEDQFRPVILKNYYEPFLFWFELDKAQTQQMIALFMKSTAPQRNLMPRITSMLDTAKSSMPRSTSTDGQASSSHEQKELTSPYDTKSWCSLFKPPPESKAVKEYETAPSSNLCDHESENPYDTKSWPSLFKPPPKSKAIKEHEAAPSSNLCDQESENPNIVFPSKADMDWESIYFPDGENMLREGQIYDFLQEQRHNRCANNDGIQVDGSEQNFTEKHLDVLEPMICHSNENSVISDGDTKTIISNNSSHQSNMEWRLSIDVASHCEETQDPGMHSPRLELSNTKHDCANGSARLEKENEVNEAETPVSLPNGAVDLSSLTEDIILKMTLSDLRIVALKLLHTNQQMKSSQLKPNHANHSLKQEQVQSEVETEALKENFRGHESSWYLSAGLGDEQCKKTLDTSLKHGYSILLVGGYDGRHFLSALDSFTPSVDNIRSLKSMDIEHSYTASVQSNNELYVLGGGDGRLWYDTVQSYNLSYDCWVSCPSLKKKKGSLAGIGLSNKIFAIGGGNVTDCFRDVEMLDLGFGKWLSIPSMLEKRFACAAVEFKGMIYVVGGYNGTSYLSSMEGFDPREQSWTRLQSMNTRRGCHALTVLNEKLYAMGGYDGEENAMVSSVEVFDPRFGSWLMAEPMNVARGYFGATTIGGSICSIGGISTADEILGSVESYSERYGWELTNLKAVGKRSAFSAVSVAL